MMLICAFAADVDGKGQSSSVVTAFDVDRVEGGAVSGRHLGSWCACIPRFMSGCAVDGVHSGWFCGELVGGCSGLFVVWPGSFCDCGMGLTPSRYVTVLWIFSQRIMGRMFARRSEARCSLFCIFGACTAFGGLCCTHWGGSDPGVSEMRRSMCGCGCGGANVLC